MARIQSVDADRLLTHIDGFAELLVDVVRDGASVGFLAPLAESDACKYWEGVAGALRGGTRHLLALMNGRAVVGSVQLDLPQLPNARHRAEVAKLLVHTGARRQGLGRSLMEAAEALAKALGRSLLVLDTRRGDPAERLYLSLGYQIAGVIPRYALSSSGTLDDTIYLYKELGI